MPTKLNLGAGHVIKPRNQGWINLDANGSLPGVDIAATVPPIPLEDESMTLIHCSHLIEHVPDTIAFMNECWRILQPGGVMEIWTPYAFTHAAFQDVTHVRFFVPESFSYFTAEMAYLDYGIKVWSQAEAEILSDGWQIHCLMKK